MDKTLRLLIVEDREDDAVLVTKALERGGFEVDWKRVETAEAMYQALKQDNREFIIADYRLPAFSAPEAIKLRDRVAPQIPLIVVSGTIGEETAAEAMKAGAQDYVMKNNLTRLVGVVEREMAEAAVRRHQREAEVALERVREQYADLIENTRDLVQSVDADKRFLFVNRAWLKTLGYTDADLPGLTLDDVVHPDSFAQCQGILAMVKDGAPSRGFQIKLRTKDGREVVVEGHTVGHTTDGKFLSTLSILHDITDRMKNEKRIVHLNRMLGLIRCINQLIVSETEERSLLQKACDRMIEDSDYGAAWISLRDDDGVIRLAVQAGTTVEGCGCVERVLEEASFEHQPLMRHECSLGRFAAGISLPLTIDGQIIGLFNACSLKPPLLTEEEHSLMLELARDLALGMEKIRKREELRQRNAFIETIMDNLPIGLAVNRVADGRTEYMNRKFQETYGWSIDLISDVNEFFEHVYPNPEHRQQIMERVMDDIASGDPRRMIWEDVEITTQSSEKRFVSAANIPLPEQGLMISTVWDVTAHHKAEEEVEFRAKLLDTVSDSVFLSEVEGRILYLNEAAYKTRGYTREELLGTDIKLLRMPEVLHDWEKRRQDLVRNKAASYETVHRCKDGTEMIVEVNARVIQSGGRSLVLSVARDITERRKMENQLVVTDRLASVGELASGIAHEINNPLTGVLGFAQLLMEKEISPDIREDVETIFNEAQRCADIVKNLLAFARQHEPLRETVDINSIVEKVLDLRAYEQRVNNVSVDKRLASKLPPIQGDYFQLQQCFLNIVINAEFFMAQLHNGGTLTVTTEHADNNIRITFTDDGPGIPPELLSRIFDPFFTTKEVGKGTGLGLSICHGLITSQGGKIRAENAPAGGASFIIELPVEPLENPVSPPVISN